MGVGYGPTVIMMPKVELSKYAINNPRFLFYNATDLSDANVRDLGVFDIGMTCFQRIASYMYKRYESF